MQLIKKKTNSRRGDTLIEVVLCVAIFSAASVGAMASMTASVNRVQYSLETTSARSLMDQQAEAIRFIHSATESLIATGECSYSTSLVCLPCNDPENDQQCEDDIIHSGNNKKINSKTYFAYLWNILSDTSLLANNNDMKNIDYTSGCKSLYRYDATTFSYVNEEHNIGDKTKIFIINPYELKKIQFARIKQWYNSIIVNYNYNASNRSTGFPLGQNNGYSYPGSGFAPAVSSPKIVYGKMDVSWGASSDNQGADNLINNDDEFKDDGYKAVRDVQGLWVQSFRMEGGKYIDFRISTCWDSPGSTTSDHLETTVRLSNPFFKVGS